MRTNIPLIFGDYLSYDLLPQASLIHREYITYKYDSTIEIENTITKEQQKKIYKLSKNKNALTTFKRQFKQKVKYPKRRL